MPTFLVACFPKKNGAEVAEGITLEFESVVRVTDGLCFIGTERSFAGVHNFVRGMLSNDDVLIVSRVSRRETAWSGVCQKTIDELCDHFDV